MKSLAFAYTHTVSALLILPTKDMLGIIW